MTRVTKPVMASVVASLLLVAGCGTAETARSPESATTVPSGTVDNSRIVPLNGDLAEIVWALGLGDNVVGTDISATYPEEASKRPHFGYARRLNAEGVLSLKPTVVIGTRDAGPPEVVEQIKSAGVPVTVIDVATSVDEIPDKIRSVAGALGVPDDGEKLASTTATRIQAATDLAGRAVSKPRVAFIYARGKDTLMLGGRGTKADGIIHAAGAIDAGTEADIDDYKPLTPEALVAAQPEVLLLMADGLASIGGIDGLLAVPGVAQTPAGQHRRILDYDGQLLLGLGPRTPDLLTRLIRDLHPELAS